MQKIKIKHMLVTMSIVAGGVVFGAATPAFAATLPASTASTTSTTYGVVANLNGYSSLDFRTGPGTDYAIISDLTSGTSVQVLSQGTTWDKISYHGVEGYAYAPCINVDGSTTAVNTNNSSANSANDVTGKIGTVANLNSGYNLNFRMGPSTSYEIIETLPQGSTFKILSESNGWYKINYNGTTGYVDGAYVSLNGTSSSSTTTTTENNTQSSVAGKVGTVVNLNGSMDLNFRTGPSADDAIIGSLSEGSTFTILSENDGWYEVKCDGTTGYVYGYYVSVGATATATQSTTSNSTSSTNVTTTESTSSNSATTSSTQSATTESTSSSTSDGTFSDLVSFTASYEGFSATPYYSGGWTVGFGQNYGSTYPGDVTYSEALSQLSTTLQGFREQVEELTSGLNLNENQINALTDFAYNLGIGSLENSQLLQDIESGNTSAQTITADFQSWSSAGGQYSSGLYARRTAEANMFLYGEYQNH